MLVKAIDFDHTGTGTGDSFIIYNLNCTYDPLSKNLNRGVTSYKFTSLLFALKWVDTLHCK